MAHEIMCNNFEISLVLFIPIITTNYATTYTNSGSPWLNNVWLMLLKIKESQPQVKYKVIKKERGSAE